jgi:hypothetical protein
VEQAFRWTKPAASSEIGVGDFEDLAAFCSLSRQRSRSVETIGVVTAANLQIADEREIP